MIGDRPTQLAECHNVRPPCQPPKAPSMVWIVVADYLLYKASREEMSREDDRITDDLAMSAEPLDSEKRCEPSFVVNISAQVPLDIFLKPAVSASTWSAVSPEAPTEVWSTCSYCLGWEFWTELRNAVILCRSIQGLKGLKFPLQSSLVNFLKPPSQFRCLMVTFFSPLNQGSN